MLQFNHECPSCAWRINDQDIGDASVYPVMLVVGCIVGGLAVWVEFTYHASLWLHAALWIPLTLLLTVFSLRISRTVYIHAQYRLESHASKGDSHAPDA